MDADPGRIVAGGQLTMSGAARGTTGIAECPIKLGS